MGKVRFKKNETPKTPPAKLIQKQAQIEVVLKLIASNGDAYRGESYESFVEAFRQFTKERWPGANFTPIGGYYLVDGKVCRVEDFDRQTMNRKPGTFPPSWSLVGDEKKDAIQAEREEEKRAEQAEKAEKELRQVKHAPPQRSKVPVRLKSTHKEVPTKKPVRIKRRMA